MKAVFLRELRALYGNLTGFLFAAFLLLFAGIYTMAYCLMGGSPRFEYALRSMTFIYLIGVPLLTMRAVGEERARGTDKLLASLPLTPTRIALAKYGALLVTLLLPTLVMALYPLLLTAFGSVYLPGAYCAIIGFFLLGAALLAVGLFISSVTPNQIASAIVTLCALLLLFFISALAGYLPSGASDSAFALILLALGIALLLYRLTRAPLISAAVLLALCGGICGAYMLWPDAYQGLFPKMIAALGVFDRFDAFASGVFDLTAVVYDVSVAGVCLFLSVQAQELRRWSV